MLCRLSVFGCCCYISFVENYACRPTLMCTTYACEQLKMRTKKQQESKKKKNYLFRHATERSAYNYTVMYVQYTNTLDALLAWPGLALASNYWNEQQKQHTVKSRVFVFFRSKLFIFNIFLFFRKLKKKKQQKNTHFYDFSSDEQHMHIWAHTLELVVCFSFFYIFRRHCICVTLLRDLRKWSSCKWMKCVATKTRRAHQRE